MARALPCLTLLALTIAVAACGDDTGPIGMVDGALTDADQTDATDADTREVGADSLDARDAAEPDILYPGYLCDEDNRCSTGLCYGTATAQGFFEPPQCQLRCLEPFDYQHYCNTDYDCCRGRCCVDCGAKSGLCTLP